MNFFSGTETTSMSSRALGYHGRGQRSHTCGNFSLVKKRGEIRINDSMHLVEGR